MTSNNNNGSIDELAPIDPARDGVVDTRQLDNSPQRTGSIRAIEPQQSHARTYEGDANYSPLQSPTRSRTAENGTRVNFAQRAWGTALARGECYTRFEGYYGHQITPAVAPLRPTLSGFCDSDPDSDPDESPRGPLSSSAGSAHDSALASPTSDPGSPVANDFVPPDQTHRKKPTGPSLENEFPSPTRKTRRTPRRSEQEEPAQKDGRQDTRGQSPSKKVRGYNVDRDDKEEYLSAKGQQ